MVGDLGRPGADRVCFDCSNSHSMKGSDNDGVHNTLAVYRAGNPTVERRSALKESDGPNPREGELQLQL